MASSIMKQFSMPSKEIIKFYSSIDPHTYWTLVVEGLTTTKDVVGMIVDKLGEQQVSRSALTMHMEIIEPTSTQSIQIGDDEHLLPFSLRLKKKYKKNAKFRFVLNGLDKIESASKPAEKPPVKKEKKLSRDNSQITQNLNNTENNANTNNENSNNKTSETLTPPPNKPTERKRSKEGAKIAVVSNSTKTKSHLTLIHVFYNNHLYWTLAIDPTCIVGDVCKILADKLSLKRSRVSLYEVEMEEVSTEKPADPSVPAPSPRVFKGFNSNSLINRLDDNILVIDILKRWGKSSKWKFFVKEDPVDRRVKSQASGEIVTSDKHLSASDAENAKSDTHKAPILICASEKNHDEIASVPPTSMISDEQRKNPINIWIPETEIKFVKKISSGAFAKVFQGSYKGKIVAVKVLKGSLSEEVIANFKHEFTILSQVKSQHLVTFYGAYIQKKLTMVMEYCSRGTLYDVLKNPSVDMDWERVLTFFTQTVQGIHALHNCTPPILHRDLKSLNLLVDDEWVVKVADFGLSRFNTVSNHSSLGRICGTMAYCAPEVYTGERFTVKSDVYSLGIILWEIVARCAHKSYKAPYSEYPYISFDFQIIIQTSTNNLRPTIPPNCPPSLVALIQACWQANPAQRPTCAEILDLLSSPSFKEEITKHMNTEIPSSSP